MRYIGYLVFLILLSCSYNKGAYICGDHECVDKQEYKKYFAKTLSLEVSIIDKKEKKKLDLISQNLKTKKDRKIFSSDKVNKNDNDKKIAKRNLRNEKKLRKLKLKQERRKLKNQAKLNKKIDKEKKSKLLTPRKVQKKSQKIITKKTIDKSQNICSDIKKCDIDEISNLLIKKGKNKKFPSLSLE